MNMFADSDITKPPAIPYAFCAQFDPESTWDSTGIHNRTQEYVSMFAGCALSTMPEIATSTDYWYDWVDNTGYHHYQLTFRDMFRGNLPASMVNFISFSQEGEYQYPWSIGACGIGPRVLDEMFYKETFVGQNIMSSGQTVYLKHPPVAYNDDATP